MIKIANQVLIEVDIDFDGNILKYKKVFDDNIFSFYVVAYRFKKDSYIFMNIEDNELKKVLEKVSKIIFNEKNK